MQILAVGDSYMSTDYFRDAFAALEDQHHVRYLDADERSAYVPETASERRLTEYLGSPRSLAAHLPGVEVLVVQGQAVSAGQPLVTLEAMKMEHVLTAPFDGVVADLKAETGGQVAEGIALVRIVAEDAA